MHFKQGSTLGRMLRRAGFALLFTAFGAVLGIGLEHYLERPDMLKTRQALIIEAPLGDAHNYQLPAGTVLYFDRALAEGHGLYHAHFYFHGTPEHDPVRLEPKHQGSLIVPTWLYAPGDPAL
ncbi:hypothetical protein NJH83_27980 [Pseudomonas chlororaphis]|uniref:hypothetical protein n=1 Tax=Pseudomonas chlororaphis TaxID=587753 RepID=UPI00209A7CDE|nr:hypothetical protein [Pseudomonas chlororaphis]MCO7614083.1 hypothetical protein [Pseudomonas chlororaphis]